MATKKEIFATVTAEVEALCKEHGMDETPFETSLMAILSNNLEPKNGGMSMNLDEVTKRDEDGNITHILCSVSNVFLPATLDFFYEDKSGKGVGETGLKRLSRQAEAIRKTFTKAVSVSEKALMMDVLDGVLSNEEGKAKLEELRAQKPDYSSVTDELPAEEDAE